jgi:hypothetical protein
VPVALVMELLRFATIAMAPPQKRKLFPVGLCEHLRESRNDPRISPRWTTCSSQCFASFINQGEVNMIIQDLQHVATVRRACTHQSEVTAIPS